MSRVIWGEKKVIKVIIGKIDTIFFLLKKNDDID